MHQRLLSSCFALLLLAACGGRVDGEPRESTSSFPASAEGYPPAGPVEGAWGTWQLLSLEDASGQRQYDPPFIEIALHPDGTAYRWTCAAAPTGNGLHCPVALRKGCLTGTIQLDGLVWRVQLSNREGSSVVGRGVIEEEASGDIRVVDGEGAFLSRAHYRRIGVGTADACTP